MLIAALALARYSYRNARQLAQNSEGSVIAGLFALGDQTRSRVESFVIDLIVSCSTWSTSNTCKTSHVAGRRLFRLSHAVEAAIVPDETSSSCGWLCQ